MVHGKNRIPYRIDRRLTGLAGPDYDAPISFGLPLEPEDSQYGKSPGCYEKARKHEDRKATAEEIDMRVKLGEFDEPVEGA